MPVAASTVVSAASARHDARLRGLGAEVTPITIEEGLSAAGLVAAGRSGGTKYVIEFDDSTTGLPTAA